MRDRPIFLQLDLSFFGRQVKLFEVDLDFFSKFSQLVTNYLVSLLKTSPLKEDRSRRLVATIWRFWLKNIILQSLASI